MPKHRLTSTLVFALLALTSLNAANTPETRPDKKAAHAAGPADVAAPAPGSLLPGGPSAWKRVGSDEFDYADAKLDERWVSQNAPSGCRCG